MPIGLITEALETVGEAAKEVAKEAVKETGETAVESVSNALRDTEVIGISQNDINTLLEKVKGIPLSKKKSDISFTGVRICGTRHGCTGATQCNTCMNGPFGR